MVVNAIQGTGSLLSPYGQIVGDIQIVLKQFRRWKVGHARWQRRQPSSSYIF
jgi:hypothetical protein